MPQGCKFEAAAGEVTEWLAVEAADRASRVFSAVEALLPPSRAALLADDAAFEARCQQAFLTVQASEERWGLGLQVCTSPLIPTPTTLSTHPPTKFSTYTHAHTPTISLSLRTHRPSLRGRAQNRLVIQA